MANTYPLGEAYHVDYVGVIEEQADAEEEIDLLYARFGTEVEKSHVLELEDALEESVTNELWAAYQDGWIDGSWWTPGGSDGRWLLEMCGLKKADGPFMIGPMKTYIAVAARKQVNELRAKHGLA